MTRAGWHGPARKSENPRGKRRARALGAWCIGAAATLAGVALVASAARAESVSPTRARWVYEALRAFEVRGLVTLEPTIPYTFDQCEGYVREIAANVEKEHAVLGPRHAFFLEELTKQFIGLRDRPEDRWTKPAFTLREDERFFATDFQVGGRLQKDDGDRGEADGLFNPDFLLGLGHDVTMETSYRLVMAPERGLNADGEKPNARLRSYRGLTAELERAVLEAGGPWWNVRLGREYANWGPDFRESLILSQTARSLDQLEGRVALGRFALTTVQASLNPVGRRLAGHRLTIALPGGASIGLSETVVYTRQSIDYRYLIPLGIFYAQQFNETSDEDNVLWAFDWKVPLHRGLLVYGEFLVDDIQYERDEGAGPDRLGAAVAADALLMVFGRELTLSGGYTAISKYTYGHMYGTQYVAGDGYTYRDREWNPLLGSPVGPDADRAFLRGTFGVSGRLALTVEGTAARYGDGSWLFSEKPLDWRPGMDNDPSFPSPPVMREQSLGASLRWDLDHASYVSAGVEGRHQDRDRDDVHATWSFGWLEVVWDL